MTSIRNFISYLLSVLVVLAGLVSTGAPAQAMDNATLSFAANKTTLNVGEQVTVSVNIAVAGTPGGGNLRLIVNYDSSKLSLANVGSAGSVFQVPQEEINTPGKFSTSRYNNSGGTSGGKVLDFTFTATAAGTTAVTFDAGSRIWEATTGIEKPLTKNATQSLTLQSGSVNPDPAPTINGFSLSPTKIMQGASATLAWDVANAQSVSINQGIGNVANKASGVVKPKVTTTYTLTATNSGGTSTRSVTLSVVPASTATPVPTTKPTATPTASSTTDPNTLSLSQSSINFSSTTAIADGVDAITVTVNLLRENGTPASDITPSVTGLRDIGDAASPFVYDDTTKAWTSFITSTEVGSTTVTIAAGGLDLASQELTFTEPVDTAEPIDTSSDSGSSFWRLLLIGLGLLILLLLILFFVWKRLHNDEDEEEYDDETDPNAPAFPGDDSSAEGNGATTAGVAAGAAAGAIVAGAATDDEEEKQDDQAAGFDANQALQRTPPAAAPTEQPQQDTTIPL